MRLRARVPGIASSVHERTASRGLRRGAYLLARVVRVGSQHQIIGAPLHLELRHRQSLMELLDGDPTPRTWPRDREHRG
jgi:hypothetical protein